MTEEVLNEHKRTKHVAEGAGHCSVCEERLSEGKDVEPVRLPCNVCKDAWGRREELFVHAKTAHNADFACDLCELKIENYKDFFVHTREAHNAAPKYDCPLCGAAFSREADVMNQKKYVHTVAEERDDGGEKREKEEATGAAACSICGFKSQAVKPKVRKDIIARHMSRTHRIGKRGAQSTESGRPQKRLKGV